MPWRCPACSTQIHHHPSEVAPRSGVVYRCPVCRLELVLGGTEAKLVVVPIEESADRPTPRTAVKERRVL